MEIQDGRITVVSETSEGSSSESGSAVIMASTEISLKKILCFA